MGIFQLTDVNLSYGKYFVVNRFFVLLKSIPVVKRCSIFINVTYDRSCIEQVRQPTFARFSF